MTTLSILMSRHAVASTFDESAEDYAALQHAS